MRQLLFLAKATTYDNIDDKSIDATVVVVVESWDTSKLSQTIYLLVKVAIDLEKMMVMMFDISVLSFY